MPLPDQSRLGPYTILGPLGAGGMGEVYRARDSKLGRDVALKVLPAAFASDPERMARFQREAQVLASLNHPHIAAIYGFEDSGGVRALVMELVEGPTLAERIANGPIFLDDARPIAREIAEALEAAHERGIVHRDLKPSNIKISPDGNVKVLDFGLAKAIEGGDSAADVQNSPTISRMATQAGIILGTAAYMSPEQAKGKSVDRRTDIWAFGCVLFEMLTGRHAFEGETVTDTLAAVIKEEPPWNTLPAATPPRVLELLHRCLIKDPKQRLQAIGEARIALDENAGVSFAAAVPVSSAAASTPSESGLRRILPWVVAAAAVLVAIALVFLRHPSPTPSEPLQASLESPPGFQITPSDIPLAVSPDGKSIAIVATGSDGKSRLWLRAIRSQSLQPLAGTEDGAFPFWSPDGAYLGFFSNGKLRKLQINGEAVETLADAIEPRGGAWGVNGQIVFAPTPYGGLFEVSSSGGTVEQVTTVKINSDSDRLPYFLPDGRHVLFSLEPGNAVGQIKPGYGVFVLDLQTKKVAPLLQEASNAVYAPPGYLLFYRDGNLMAQPFDAKGIRLEGAAIPIADKVSYDADRWTAQFSVSQNGLLVYLKGGMVPLAELTWFTIDGKKLATVGDPKEYVDVSISHSGTRALITQTIDNGVPSLWMADVSRGILSRFDFAPRGSNDGLWSLDDGKLIFNDDAGQIFEMASDGGSAPTPILPGSDNIWVQSWSPDGRFLLWNSETSSGVWQMGVLPLTGDRKPYSYLPSPAKENEPSFSADGHWISFLSDESGTMELYVSPFPGPGGKWQVSSGGVVDGGWLKTGSSLVYVASQSKKLMEVSVTVQANEPHFSNPRELFGGQPLPSSWNIKFHTFNWIEPDGKRLLLPVPVGPSGPTGISLVTNWPGLVTKRP